MLQPTEIIKRPLLTEKGTWEGSARNRYTFEVPLHVTKPQIRAAVQSLYNVRVESVATQVRKGKYHRTKFGQAKSSDWKRAVVQLHPEDKIELF